MNLEYPANRILESCEEISIRPYLLLSEEDYIVNALKDIEDRIKREFTLDCLLLEACAEVDSELNYDLLKANNVFEEIRMILSDYIDDIRTALAYEDSLDKSVKEFLAEMSVLVEKTVKKIPSQNKLEKALNGFLKTTEKKTDSSKGE